MQHTSSAHDRQGSSQSFAAIHERLSATANERLKARSPLLLNRSLILAATLHGALLLFSPDWIRSAAAPGGSGVGPGIQVVAFGSDPEGWDSGWESGGERVDPDGGASPLLTSVDPAASVEGAAAPQADSHRADVAGETGDAVSVGPSGGPGSGWGRTTGRPEADLHRLADLRPELSLPAGGWRDPASPGSESELSDSALPGREGDGDVGNGGDGHARSLRSELTEQLDDRLTREEILDLERLSALRPELAITSPSNWILVRNPVEVGEFLERRFGSPHAGEGPRGTMSVAIWIDERGSVEWAEINRSSGEAELDRSALELFERVVSFSPAREDGFRVPTAVIFWLSFW
ncbi:MAG: TonB family protein [Gemmatimonadales bacterium]|nr:MAG: TonB family protein [Gemmatimonadales bacterium]